MPLTAILMVAVLSGRVHLDDESLFNQALCETRSFAPWRGIRRPAVPCKVAMA
jgi:hypothetical protein